MLFPDPMKKATEEAMADPQVGDRFTEMYSFYVYVVGRMGSKVTVLEAYIPCNLPRDGKKRVFDPVREFQAAYAYGYDPERGYWIRLCDRGNNVGGWV